MWDFVINQGPPDRREPGVVWTLWKYSTTRNNNFSITTKAFIHSEMNVDLAIHRHRLFSLPSPQYWICTLANGLPHKCVCTSIGYSSMGKQSRKKLVSDKIGV